MRKKDKKMKEIVIISGKGGTGKTSLTASFAKLASDKFKSVFVDCDVDAADLHLILKPEILEKHRFISGNEAVIDPDKCAACGRCKELCRFGAIIQKRDGRYFIDSGSCEGCGVCVHFCPSHAINFPERFCGDWFVSRTRFGTLIHSQLAPQAENSGKLVSLLREEAKKKAAVESADLIIVDGSPGIGCPVIASITGADAVVAVTEPSLSGLHDLERAAQLVNHFNIPLFVCISKWDINADLSERLQEKSLDYNATMLGRIDYDEDVTLAQLAELSLMEYKEGKTSKQITEIWENLCQQIVN
jgi:MinD superfamily P-loop ATPase